MSYPYQGFVCRAVGTGVTERNETMRYRYEGFLANGTVKRGFIDAADPEDAAAKLREMAIFAQKVEPDGPEPMKSVLPGGPPLDSGDRTPAPGAPPGAPMANLELDPEYVLKRIEYAMKRLDPQGWYEIDRDKFRREMLHAGLMDAGRELVKRAVMESLKSPEKP